MYADRIQGAAFGAADSLSGVTKSVPSVKMIVARRIFMERLIDIHKADDSEKELLISMWLRRTAYLKEINNPMWNPEQFSFDSLNEKYGNPGYFIGYADGRPFGGFLLIEYDERYWPGRKERAYYFHKFVIDEKFGGQGLSGVILQWVQAYGVRNGKEYIRLDFEEEREYLKKLYYGNGFRKTGVVTDSNGKEITLAEYKIHESGCLPA
ncbi:MAG TPA: hypothetical protein DCL73_10790 [Treponema sp.]|mgnify:CR=1 FL=1|nr:hypothetical protein [Treponema sp.]